MVKHRRHAAKRAGAPRGKDLLGVKQQLVKNVPNNYVYMAGGGLITIGVIYYAVMNGMVPGFSADNATVKVYPAQVKTGEPVTFEGDFRTNAGGAATLPTGFLAIFEDSGNKVYDTTLGMFVSHYKISVNTANFRDGTYTVVVSDKPISAPAGVTPNPATGINALSPNVPPQVVTPSAYQNPSLTVS